MGTNGSAPPLAFQSWHRFKEAFSPELVKRVICGNDHEVNSCLDPFGGSGTTALSAQLLGVSSTTVEINPFLADVIRAKTATYDADRLAYELGEVTRAAVSSSVDAVSAFAKLPPTFIEPGVSDRWIFDRDVADRLAALLGAIEGLKEPRHRLFFRAILGGILVDVSNVVVWGKGRRYRRDWQSQRKTPRQVQRLFEERASSAIVDVHLFGEKPKPPARVIQGDARRVNSRRVHDVAVFSPPYPNSFDYTDVYNLELWMLGYLTDSQDNRELRQATLSSHVQLQRDFARPPQGSSTLKATLKRLSAVQGELWSSWIPAMVGGYFADMVRVLARVQRQLGDGSRCWVVIGDSKYADVLVPSGRILAQLATESGWQVMSARPFRAMQSSAQHGGRAELSESLLILRKTAD